MSDVTITRDGSRAVLTIDRPNRRNALSGAVVDDLRAAFRTLAAEPDVEIVVLTGAGDVFSAGGDISDFQPDAGMLEMHHARGSYAELLLEMQRFPRPIVARVNGHALGGGFGLVLNCDLAVASLDATLGTPEVKVGLFPMMIMALISRTMGKKEAMELMLTGGKLDASRAVELGCINRAVPSDQLDAAVDELVDRVTSFSPAILRLGRKAYYETQDMTFEQALRTLHNELTITTMSEDAAEGIMAFLGRREPEWNGR